MMPDTHTKKQGRPSQLEIIEREIRAEAGELLTPAEITKEATWRLFLQTAPSGAVTPEMIRLIKNEWPLRWATIFLEEWLAKSPGFNEALLMITRERLGSEITRAEQLELRGRCAITYALGSFGRESADRRAVHELKRALSTWWLGPIVDILAKADRLPSIRELARLVGVSHSTLARSPAFKAVYDKFKATGSDASYKAVRGGCRCDALDHREDRPDGTVPD